LKTPLLTGVDHERRALQIEGEGNSVGTDGDELSETSVAANFIPVIHEFVY